MGVHLNPFTSQLDIVDSPSGDFSDLTLSAGTAAAPSISFTGDPNTGLYSPGTDQVALSTNGTGRLFIDSSGNVGIGTTSPTQKLQITDGSLSNFYIAPGYGGGAGTTIGVGGGEYLAFNGAPFTTERMRIDSSGNVGIGTSSPSTPLHITSSSAGGLVNITSTSTSAALVFNDSGTGANYPKIGSEGSNLVLRGGAVSNAAYIDASGRLLVGTSSSLSDHFGGSGTQLQIAGTSYQGSAAQLNAFATNQFLSPHLVLNKARGTQASPLSVVNNDKLGGIVFTGYAASTPDQIAARIECFVDGDPETAGDTSDLPGRLVFSSTPSGSATPAERMRLDSDGTLLLGVTTKVIGQTTNPYLFFQAQSNVTTAGMSIESYGNNIALRYHFAFTNPNGVVGTISTNGTATAYNTSSDYRLKENVTAVTDGITRLQQLKPSRFNFIADPDKTVDGFIAHEVQTIVPEAITGEKDAVDDNGDPVYQGIDQSKLVPLLTAALQEAIGEIESLKARVAALESA